MKTTRYNRREFLKNSCKVCAVVSLTGISITACTPAFPIVKTKFSKGTVSVPLTSFAESNLVIVRDLDVEFDVLVVKKNDGDFRALYMKCSHQHNSLTAIQSGLHCSAHGSSFDLDGNPTKEPATLPLTQFQTELKTDSVNITIPQNR